MTRDQCINRIALRLAYKAGVEPHSLVCQQIPMQGKCPTGGTFYYVPSPDWQMEAWLLFVPVATTAFEEFEKMKDEA